MKSIIILFLYLFSISTNAQVKILTWNVENLGSSKTDSIINYIANTINPYDIVALQEVVASSAGAQAVAKLAGQLNRKGSHWDYAISDPTSSSAYKVERYAFLWKTAAVKLIGTPWLERKYHLLIDREPYYATFGYDGKQFTIASFHAITKSNQPETEIKYFRYIPAEYPNLNIVFLGDFNCPQSHTVFNPLRGMGYQPAFTGQKTSLKKSCKQGECLASEFDNIWYNNSTIEIRNPEAIHFYSQFSDFSVAREISDHIPLVIELRLK